MIKSFLCAVLFATMPAFLAAQEGTGALVGRVLDPDSNPVERLEADVVVKDQSGKTFTGKVSVDGTYEVRDLPAGSYELSLALPTRLFVRYTRSGIVVAPGAPTSLDLGLEWGMNLGTVGDDPLLQGADLRAKTKNVDGPVPRTADGKPDFSGVWVNFGDSFAGAVPMKPWAQAMNDELRKLRQDNPGAYCLPQSALMTTTNYPYKFIQTPEVIVQLIEDMVVQHRQIFMDGRGHPDPDEWNPAWYGHSIGRWEGDTLVVETQGFNEVAPGFGIHTEGLKLTERYTRTSYGLMEIEVVAEDPEAWTGPWVRKIRAGLAEGTEITEFVCAEGHPAHVTRNPWKGRP